ncbi:MAG: hypothetical protein HXL15_01710 [Parvimonas sp.]|jgi:hypothetical protein|uniref:Uncharacterized protein n=1 Tax=Siphoviridae sp. ctnR613 TaxID=2827939 RepID=A0A8S5SNX4_9CAUD|nr:hypothetical protein [Parvimonas sp.]DAF52662.1 MAG TPA: hypothetical protein [Siphoviridae sp. ctnR613]DAK67180.1 MAG TPA: hypothetical protein [Caudoviricetes sp.]
MTKREIELKETIESIVENDLKELWINHRENSHYKNGYVNMAFVQNIRKRIVEKLRKFEK